MSTRDQSRLTDEEFSATYEKRPWTVNTERSGGKRGLEDDKGKPFYLRRAELVKEWRDYFAVETIRLIRTRGLEVPWPTVEVACVLEQVGGVLQDPGACFPAYKAALDGIKDGGLITEDGPDTVRRVLFTAPRKSNRDALTVVVSRVYGI